MSRYIDAEELREVVKQWDMQDLYLPVHFLDLIEDIPTADVAEVRHGKWLNVGGSTYKCSECGFGFVNLGCRWSHNYCQNCGAKMDGGDDE